ncbi:hypothetical protein KDW_22520 [Dictyobacter vulcani]|uniref:DUF4388 domain-containing protein n=1 Tax=Dictyobacter vulcani TaxID=2607529 RepID=A0A5J4KNW2_9CHLR|nr:DUF4388 domain-containing protein [Dictyobacter vulcani]GER88090.1 hypothetical protein KDW_22520 [Dictyobacter vulcani]
MSDQTGTITDRLADVMRVITFSRQTGMLTVERGGNEGSEIIYVRFLKGKVIGTQVAPYYTGANPVEWLQSWGTCRFKFEHIAENKLNSPEAQFPTPPQTQPKSPSRTITTSPATISRNTDPLRPVISPFVQPGFPLSGPISRQQTDPYQTPLPASLYQTPLPVQRIPHKRFANNENSLRHLGQQGLSRGHRQVFLLIDNQRTPQELARLTSRRLDEVYMILTDLERIGLITL